MADVETVEVTSNGYRSRCLEESNEITATCVIDEEDKKE